MRIMVFLHGTILMQSGAAGTSGDEKGRQTAQVAGSPAHDFESFVPVGNAVEKVNNWKDQGAEIVYLSSHRNPDDVEKDRRVLAKYGFPPAMILFRRARSESYASVAEKASPDVIVEDDCLSIGGEPEMTYPNMSDDAKMRVKSIVVKEHGGIDHLPDNIDRLRDWTSGSS